MQVRALCRTEGMGEGALRCVRDVTDGDKTEPGKDLLSALANTPQCTDG